MSIFDPTSPYERFMDPADRERLITSLQRQFRSVSSDEIEDSHSDMLERLTRMSAEQVAEIENPATWMYVGMRNRLIERLRLRRSSDVHFGDLTDVDVLGDILSDDDDSVVGSLVGRETVDERVAEIAEIVWLKFTGDDGQIAARLLLEKEGPHAVASEMGLELSYVQKVAKKAYEEIRILERKVAQDPEFRCWRLRKHMNAYYSTGEVSLALQAHWITCPKCKAAKRTAQEHTRRVLAPFLPAAAAPAGLLGFLRHSAHHALHPARSVRRLVRPAAQLGGKTATGTQVSGVAGAISTKAAVVAVAAVVTAGGASAVVVTQHTSKHHQQPVVTTTSAAYKPAPSSTLAPITTATTATRTTNAPRHRPVKHKPRTKRKHHRARRHAHVATTTTRSTITTPAPPVTTPAVAPTPVTAPPATTATPAPATTTSTPPAKTTVSSPSSPSGGQVTNPSYQTPSAP